MNQSSPNPNPAPDSPGMREFEALCHRIQLGFASADELASYNEALRSSEACRRLATRLLIDEALLRQELAVMSSAGWFASEAGAPLVSPAGDASTGSLAPVAKESHTLDYPQHYPKRCPQPVDRRVGLSAKRWVGAGQLAACFLLGALVTLASMRPLAQQVASRQDALPSPSRSPELVQVAHVRSASGMLWSDRQASLVRPGAIVTAGDTVRLASGFGSFEIRNGVNIHVEGPAEIQLDENGAITLRHGRVCVEATEESEGQRLVTSLTTLQLSASSLVCLSSSGDGGEVHVIKGSVMATPKPVYDSEATPVVEEGQSILWDISHNGRLRFWENVLESEKFASLTQMTRRAPAISHRYAQGILQDRPILYWRFASSSDRLLFDEVTGDVTGAVSGGATPVSQGFWSGELGESNYVMDLGFGSTSGSLASLQPLDGLHGNTYSIELWVKPLSRQLGVLASMVSTDVESGSFNHGTVLEVQEPFRNSSRVRFTHRDPPGPSGGDDCFSSVEHGVGVWLHVVAVKDDARLTIYIDGEAESRSIDPVGVAPGLSLLVGQLYPTSPTRPFVGQLDEVAVYDYALSAEQIESHYRMAMEDHPQAQEELGSQAKGKLGQGI